MRSPHPPHPTPPTPCAHMLPQRREREERFAAAERLRRELAAMHSEELRARHFYVMERRQMNSERLRMLEEEMYTRDQLALAEEVAAARRAVGDSAKLIRRLILKHSVLEKNRMLREQELMAAEDHLAQGYNVEWRRELHEQVRRLHGLAVARADVTRVRAVCGDRWSARQWRERTH